MDASYSLAASLNLLRLSSIDPSAASEDAVYRTLLLALMHGDFASCASLLTSQHQSLPKVAAVLNIANHLASSDFVEFWASTSSARKTIEIPNSFVPAMQDRIAHLLSITFNRIKVAVLRSYLNLNEADLKSFVASKNGWSIQGDIVTFPKSATTKSSSANRTQELVSLVALSPMLRSVTVGF